MHECESPPQPSEPLLTAPPEQLCDPLLSAAKGPRHWLTAGFLLAFVGAVLVFALKESDPSALGVSLRPLGGVLFAAGVLMIAGAGIASIGGNGGGLSAEGIKSVGGLIAVVVGVIAVTTLAIVTLTLYSDNKDSVIAITSSAFGVISAVVGAYLGIKISSESNAEASGAAHTTVLAKQEEHVTRSELEATRAKADDLVTPEQAAKIKKARVEAGERARTTVPRGGGGSA